MELNIKIDNSKLKEFGLESIFKEAQKQMSNLNQNIVFKDFKRPIIQDLNAEENLEELKFQDNLNKPLKKRYSKDEIIQMQTTAILELRKEVMKIVESMSVNNLVNFIRRFK